jgi:leader peptidase (prepilin peptidase)/N-methyltransferase
VVPLVVALLAAATGPLLRGLIVRYPVSEESADPTAWRRDCAACGRALPGAGWRGVAGPLAPTGRCPRCAARIGPAPWLVEVVAGAVCGLLAWRVADPWTLAALCWLGLAGVALAFVDVAVHRLPDLLTLPTYLGVLVLLAGAAVANGEPGRLGVAFLSGLGVAAFYFVLVLISPAGMGLGDVKLGLSTGTALGWPQGRVATRTIHAHRCTGHGVARRLRHARQAIMSAEWPAKPADRRAKTR